MISQERVTAICAALTEAGGDWVEVALTIPEIVDARRGDDRHRDIVTLSDEWEMTLRNGGSCACPGVCYLNEVSGEWRPQGWSNASAMMLYRPLGVVYDPDAGTWISTVDEPCEATTTTTSA